MTGKQLGSLEHGFLMALCVMDFYRLQGTEESLTVGQFGAVQGLDWNELEELREYLVKKGVLNEG